MNKKVDIDTNLEPVLTYFKTQSALADALGLDPMAITQWKRRGIPPTRAKEIADLTNGAVRPVDIKPRFFSDSGQ
jgi:DNA-binding transcriptional regulator YdaS (Cro superfamily)